MVFLTIVHHYLLWHYSRAFSEIFHVWLNLIWFVVHFFSIPQLMGSWFSPWKRMTESREKKWNIEDLIGSIIVNLVSRILGFILRSMVILAGLTGLFIVVAGGFIVYAFWVAAPLIMVAMIWFGLTLLSSGS